MIKKINLIISVIITITLIIPIFNNIEASDISDNITYNKINEDMKELIDSSSNGELIPVYIWLKDINQNSIEDKVEKSLGFTIEDLKINTADIDNELAQKIATIYENVSDEVITEFKQYFIETESKRIAEKELTEKYIDARRNLSKEAYVENNNKFIDDSGILSNRIMFKSEYAPLIVAELTKSEIESLLTNDDVINIEPYVSDIIDLPMPWNESINNNDELYSDDVRTGMIEDETIQIPEDDDVEWSTLSVIKESMRINDVYEKLGLSGDGVTIGMIDHGTVNFSEEIPDERFDIVGTASYHPHADNSAKIVAGTNGIAYEAYVYSVVDSGDLIGYMEAIESLLEKQVMLITCSRNMGGYAEAISNYQPIAAWTDHVSSYHNVTFIAAVGNGPGWWEANGYNIIAPANADNVISVAGFNNMETVSTSDDIMMNHCHDNGNQALKPDIVACSNVLDGGSSSATPFVSGVVALMFQLRPSLSAYPEAVKAILMASCHYKAKPYDGTTYEYMSDGITQKQGAGCFSPYYAIAITAQGNYGVKTIDSDSNIDFIRLEQPCYGSGMNVSIAWLKNTHFNSTNHITQSFTQEARSNLNLYLYQENANIAQSINTVSSTEMLYVSPSGSSYDYTIGVQKISGPDTSVRYGYAWSLNNEKIQYTQEYEGIYFLKNKKSGCYAESSTNILQLGYNGSDDQKWIIVNESNNYKIKSVTGGNNQYISYGNLISGQYYGVDLNNIGSNIEIEWNTDGSVSFTYKVSGEKYAIGVLNNSTNTSTRLSWYLYDNTNDSQKWYLEKIAYRKGDVNMDCIIDSNDSQLVLQYASRLISLDTVSLFLADVNGDDVVDSNDSLLILKIAAGL